MSIADFQNDDRLNYEINKSFVNQSDSSSKQLNEKRHSRIEFPVSINVNQIKQNPYGHQYIQQIPLVKKRITYDESNNNINK